MFNFPTPFSFFGRQKRKAASTIFKVFGMTRDPGGIEIKPGIRLPEISPIMIGKLQTNILGPPLEVSKLILKTSSPSMKI